MPKYRQLHVKIIDSFDFAEMPNDFTRVVWMLLIVIVDSEGRGIYNMAWIKSKMFPLREDVTAQQLKDAFLWLVNRKMIQVYSVSDREYFFIPSFNKYQSGTQKEAASNIPEPQENNSRVTPELLQSNSNEEAEEVRVAASASASAIESESEIGAVFKTYQSEIGVLTADIKDRINDDLTLYPPAWMIDSFKEASRNNKRSLAYSEAILKRWKADGKGSKSNSGYKSSQDPTPAITFENGIAYYHEAKQ